MIDEALELLPALVRVMHVLPTSRSATAAARRVCSTGAERPVCLPRTAFVVTCARLNAIKAVHQLLLSTASPQNAQKSRKQLLRARTLLANIRSTLDLGAARITDKVDA